jgi:hypothetical protein
VTSSTVDAATGSGTEPRVDAEEAVERILRHRLGLEADPGPLTDAPKGVEAALAGKPALVPAPDCDHEASARDLVPALMSWLAATGTSREAFQADRLGFLLDGGGSTDWEPGRILRAAWAALRERNLITRGHRLSVIWTNERPSMVFPLKVPGATAMALPTRSTRLSFGYVHHELGHVVELDGRPRDWSFERRWTRDPRVAEGWGLLIETLARDCGWLEGLGLSADDAASVATHCTREERYNRSLAACILLAAELPAHRQAAAVEDLAGGLLRPGHILGEVTRVSYWRALVAGYVWRDAVVTEHGPSWWRSPQACERLRALRAAPYETALPAGGSA